MAKALVRDLINAGVHFGHGVSKWNPKMAPFIFAKRGNIHIIDVKKTIRGILIAKKLIIDVVASGKDVVFVGTKRQAQKAVEEVAAKCGMHFVSHRWLGGMLTNFRTVRTSLQRLEELESLQNDGLLESQSKKEASRLKRELKKIKSNLDGVRKMNRPPGVVVVVDTHKEYIALREARKLGIATVGIIDTDCDPDGVDVAIPANDDSIRAVDLILNELAEAVAVGKTMVTSRQVEMMQHPKRVRPRRPALARAGTNRRRPEDGVEAESAAEETEPELPAAPAEQPGTNETTVQ